MIKSNFKSLLAGYSLQVIIGPDLYQRLRRLSTRDDEIADRYGDDFLSRLHLFTTFDDDPTADDLDDLEEMDRAWNAYDMLMIIFGKQSLWEDETVNHHLNELLHQCLFAFKKYDASTQLLVSAMAESMHD